MPLSSLNLSDFKSTCGDFSSVLSSTGSGQLSPTGALTATGSRGFSSTCGATNCGIGVLFQPGTSTRAGTSLQLMGSSFPTRWYTCHPPVWSALDPLRGVSPTSSHCTPNCARPAWAPSTGGGLSSICGGMIGVCVGGFSVEGLPDLWEDFSSHVDFSQPEHLSKTCGVTSP